jgi:hypothetical protein
MKIRHALIAVFVSIATSGYSLNIIPTFDSSITGAPNSAAIISGINFALQTIQSNIADNVSVNITFVADENIGLGQSLTFGDDYSYADYLAALRSRATSVNDTNALSQLPNSSVDPVIGGSLIHLTTAQARMLGLDSYSGIDSTVSFKMSLMNLTRQLVNPGKYDFISTVEHEVDEVLGISSGLPNTSVVWPVDLFRYTTNRVRTFTTSGDDAYFCVDGTNLLARYNMNPGGDYADFWSFTGHWAPPGSTPHSQVQDAFAYPNATADLGTNELAALDVVGWTLVKPLAPLLLTIVRTSANHYTISWPSSYTGFVLQENTNLLDAAGWVESASGSANPAILVSTSSQKFYRLGIPPNSLTLPAAAPANAGTTTTHRLVKRSLQPGTP